MTDPIALTRDCMRAFDLVPGPVWIIARDGSRALAVNAAARDLFGSAGDGSAQDLPGGLAALAARLPDCPELTESWIALPGDAQGGGILVRSRPALFDGLPCILSVGEPDPAPRSAPPARPEAAANVDGLLATLTALRQRDLRLRVAERRLGLGVWECDLETRCLVWSPRVFEIVGLSPEAGEPSLETYIARTHPDDRAQTRAAFAAFLRDGARDFAFRHRILRPDGSVAHLRAVGQRERVDGRDILIGCVLDETEAAQLQDKVSAAARLQKLAGRIARLGGWRYDAAAARLHWTPQTAALHEEPEDFTPDLAQAIAYYVPEHRERIGALFDACLRRGEPFEETLRLVTAKGKPIWVRATGEAVRDPAGRIVALEGALQDVSELLEERDRSRAQARRLHQTLDHIGDAFLLVDADWRLVFVNAQAERLLGRCRAQLLGHAFTAAYPPAAQSFLEDALRRALAGGTHVRVEDRFDPLGIWLSVDVHPTPEGLAVYLRDITEQREAEAAIRLTEDRFRLVARATGNAIWDWDIPRDQHWWSEGLTDRFGHPRDPDGGLATVWEQNLHPDDRDRLLAAQQALLQGQADALRETYRFRCADGSWATVEDHALVIRDHTGRPVRLMGSMNDITERVQLEERLRQSQKLEAVGQLTGGIAHDFNNLLTVILGNAELLREALRKDPDLGMLAEMTGTAAERGAELTRRLLAFSRRQPLEPRVLDPNALLSGMEGMLRRTLGEHVNIAIARAHDLWLTEVDAGQLEAAILNLALNARDAMPDGGALTIETANAALDDDYAAAEIDLVPGQYVVVVVTDTGHGMTPQTVARAFEPFFTTKEIGKGSGLGLSMVFGFVKQSGGHVRIYSEPGLGTAVKLYFPRADAPVAAMPEPVRPRLVGGDETILVVEDEPMVREHVVLQLKALGYSVIDAGTGPDALGALAGTGSIDLLFTDIVMPGGMSGPHLAEIARRDRPALKVLYTSGYTETSILHQGRLDPGVELLTKPYRRDTLACRVRKVLDEV